MARGSASKRLGLCLLAAKFSDAIALHNHEVHDAVSAQPAGDHAKDAAPASTHVSALSSSLGAGGVLGMDKVQMSRLNKEVEQKQEPQESPSQRDRQWAPFSALMQEPVVATFRVSQDPGDNGALMKFLSGIFEAVKSEDFMRNITDLGKHTRDLAIDYMDESEREVETFVRASTVLSPEELVPLTAELFNNQSISLHKFSKKRREGNGASVSGMPEKVREVVMPMFETISGKEPNETKVMSGRATVAETCGDSLVLLGNLSDMRDSLSKTGRMINGTKKVMPLLQNYLETMRPAVVPRVMYVMDQLLDSERDALNNMTVVVTNFIPRVRSVLKTRMGCEFSAACGRLGAGLLASALALLALGRQL